MKISRYCPLLLAAILINGCALFHHHRTKAVKPALAAPSAASSNTNTATAVFKPIITPSNSLTARVADYNSTGQFVVLTFPIGQMPKMDQTMFLYRNGLKVGEVKITGPKQDNDIVADLVTGTARVGDEVRGQ